MTARSVIALVAIVTVYFLPSWVAFFRDNRNTAALFVFNLFFGWTGIGWALSLVWAFAK